MGKSWTKAPVFYALAHVQFNAISAMDKYASDIGEQLRKLNYSDFQESREPVFSIDLTSPNDGPKKILQEEVARWRISNKESTAGYVLLRDGLVFHTTAYKDRDELFAAIKQGLDIVHGAASIDFVERVGLRYLDAIQPKEGDSLDQYISPSVRGFGALLETGGGVSHSMSETLANTPHGTLVAKSFTARGPDGMLAVPPELVPIHLKMNERFLAYRGVQTVIDIDCFHVGRTDFSSDAVVERLRELREGVGLAFDAAVTDYAREQWQ